MLSSVLPHVLGDPGHPHRLADMAQSPQEIHLFLEPQHDIPGHLLLHQILACAGNWMKCVSSTASEVKKLLSSPHSGSSVQLCETHDFSCPAAKGRVGFPAPSPKALDGYG